MMSPTPRLRFTVMPSILIIMDFIEQLNPPSLPPSPSTPTPTQGQVQNRKIGEYFFKSVDTD